MQMAYFHFARRQKGHFLLFAFLQALNILTCLMNLWARHWNHFTNKLSSLTAVLRREEVIN